MMEYWTVRSSTVDPPLRFSSTPKDAETWSTIIRLPSSVTLSSVNEPPPLLPLHFFSFTSPERNRRWRTITSSALIMT